MNPDAATDFVTQFFQGLGTTIMDLMTFFTDFFRQILAAFLL